MHLCSLPACREVATLHWGIGGLALSPDGKIIATGADTRAPGVNHGLSLWDSHSGNLLRRFGPYEVGIGPLAFSPNGASIACGNCAHESPSAIALWNVTPELRIWIYHAPSKENIVRIAFSPDGKRIVAFGFAHVTVLDSKTGRLVRTLGGSFDWSTASLVRRDAAVVATGSKLILVSLQTGKMMRGFSSLP
jgi:WD40 repeat protein